MARRRDIIVVDHGGSVVGVAAIRCVSHAARVRSPKPENDGEMEAALSEAEELVGAEDEEASHK